MKRLYAMILTVCLLGMLSTTVVAEGSNNLSGYGDSELVELLEDVQREIAVRRIEKTAYLTAGTYIGGRDIPAGTYTLAANGIEGEHGIVSLRSVNDPIDDYPSKLYEHKMGNQAYSVYITIEDGDTLVLPFPYTLTISGGVMFK